MESAREESPQDVDFKIDVDMGVNRKFRISERFELRIRGESFNLANTPPHANPLPFGGRTPFVPKLGGTTRQGKV